MKTLKEIEQMGLKDVELARELSENGYTMIDYSNYVEFLNK